MRVAINGKEQEIEAGITVAALIAQYQLEPRHVAVEINYDLVTRSKYDSTTVKEGDQLEIVTLVGGG